MAELLFKAVLKSLPKLRQRNPQVDLTLVEFQGCPLGSWHCGQVPEIWLLGWQCDLRAVQGSGMWGSGTWGTFLRVCSPQCHCTAFAVGQLQAGGSVERLLSLGSCLPSGGLEQICHQGKRPAVIFKSLLIPECFYWPLEPGDQQQLEQS